MAALKRSAAPRPTRFREGRGEARALRFEDKGTVMTQLADLGVFGLSVMGGNLARNAARKGFGVALFNRHGARTDALISRHGSEGRFVAAKSLAEFAAALAKPRAVLIMVKAGKPVDDVIEELLPISMPGDIVIDGGNSLFTDTQPARPRIWRRKSIRFIGTGVSGGEEGALQGPSIMPGGDAARPMTASRRSSPKSRPRSTATPCCAYIGPDGAGHYVKMVHNGIEYADMQLIAEAYDLLRHGLRPRRRRHRRHLRRAGTSGDLNSYLIEITADVLRKPTIRPAAACRRHRR